MRIKQRVDDIMAPMKLDSRSGRRGSEVGFCGQAESCRKCSSCWRGVGCLVSTDPWIGLVALLEIAHDLLWETAHLLH